MESLLIEKPANPVAFMIEYLYKQFPDQAKAAGVGPAADASASQYVSVSLVYYLLITFAERNLKPRSLMQRVLPQLKKLPPRRQIVTARKKTKMMLLTFLCSK